MCCWSVFSCKNDVIKVQVVITGQYPSEDLSHNIKRRHQDEYYYGIQVKIPTYCFFVGICIHHLEDNSDIIHTLAMLKDDKTVLFKEMSQAEGGVLCVIVGLFMLIPDERDCQEQYPSPLLTLDFTSDRNTSVLKTCSSTSPVSIESNSPS